MDQPAWLTAAWAEFGVREVAGTGSNARVADYFQDTGHAEIRDDATPWCAAFLGSMLKRGSVAGTGSLLARSYLAWGDAIADPRPGAITVLTRGDDPGAGHVGFYLGETPDSIVLLGGNQSDRVTVEAFEKGRLLGHRWPSAASNDAPPDPAAADGFETALAHVLEMEGGYTNDPYDPGGPTNRGVTLEVYARFKGVSVDASTRARLIDELKNIPDDDVRAIYRVRYWEPALCAVFTAPLALLHFDAAVNHGVRGAALLLQRAVRVAADGEIGPQTLGAVARLPLSDLLAAYADARRQRYRALPHFWRFGRGWLRRVDATLALGRRLAAAGAIGTGLSEIQQTAKGETIMTDERDQTPDSEVVEKWWVQSKTVWGTFITAVATVVPLIGPLFGIHVPGEIIKEAGDQVMTVVQAIMGLFGTLLAIYGRTTASGPLARRSLKVRL